jgi:hypothetical protein
VGANPAYGYRRLMLSADGTPRQILERGEQKSLKTDRVVLVTGPIEEVERVRSIFSMALQGRVASVPLVMSTSEEAPISVGKGCTGRCTEF